MSLDGAAHDSADAAASAWFARRRRGPLSAVETREWEQWSAAPAHADAYRAVEHLWAQIDTLQSAPSLVRHRRRALRSAARLPLAIAASLAACVAGYLFLQAARPAASEVYAATTPKIVIDQADAAQPSRSYRTALGEQRAITLADGSTLTLDTDSEVQVTLARDQRLVTLHRGRAFFAVAKDRTRPFIVSAGSERVMAVGTAFDVRLEGDGMSVTLQDGRVRIEEAAPVSSAAGRVTAADLVPGSTLRTSHKRQWRVARADVTRELSWLHHQLVFDDATLEQVVAEINRYSTTKLVLGDPSLAAVAVGGVFGVDNPASVADALAHYGLVRIGDVTAARITLLPP